jgi:hypothetical protein
MITVWLTGPVDEMPLGERRKLVERFSALLGLAPDAPRLAARDLAVREALKLYPGAPSRAAKDLTRDLSRYVDSGWARERDLPRALKGSPARKRKLSIAWIAHSRRARASRFISRRAKINCASGRRQSPWRVCAGSCGGCARPRLRRAK